MVGEVGNAEVVDDDPDVTDGRSDASRELIEQRARGLRVARHEGACTISLQRHRRQGRAEPVVELTAEAQPLLLASGNKSLARKHQLVGERVRVHDHGRAAARRR